MGSESGGPGEIRSAADGLRQVRGGLPGEAEEVDQGIRASIDEVSALVEQAAVGDVAPELRRVAHEIRVLGTRMTGVTEDAFAPVDAALASEAGALEALLRPDDGDAGGVVVGGVANAGAVSGSGELAVVVGWPLYVSGDLASRAADAATVHGWKPEGKAVNRPVNQVVAQLPAKLQAVGGEILRDRSSHAVSRHGHHLTVEHELARIQWLHDPAYQDRWVLTRRFGDVEP